MQRTAATLAQTQLVCALWHMQHLCNHALIFAMQHDMLSCSAALVLGSRELKGQTIPARLTIPQPCLQADASTHQPC